MNRHKYQSCLQSHIVDACQFPLDSFLFLLVGVAFRPKVYPALPGLAVHPHTIHLLAFTKSGFTFWFRLIEFWKITSPNPKFALLHWVISRANYFAVCTPNPKLRMTFESLYLILIRRIVLFCPLPSGFLSAFLSLNESQMSTHKLILHPFPAECLKVYSLSLSTRLYRKVFTLVLLLWSIDLSSCCAIALLKLFLLPESVVLVCVLNEHCFQLSPTIELNASVSVLLVY